MRSMGKSVQFADDAESARASVATVQRPLVYSNSWRGQHDDWGCLHRPPDQQLTVATSQIVMLAV